jgi:hypothetical protein
VSVDFPFDLVDLAPDWSKAAPRASTGVIRATVIVQ